MNAREPLWESSVPEPAQPVLLAGPRSVAVLSGAGEFRLEREFRGLPTECAGVSALGVRLGAAWTLEFGRAPALTPLERSMRSLRVGRASLESRHADEGLELAQTVYPTAEPAGAVRELCLRATGPGTRGAVLTSRFVPELTPLLLEGTRPHRYRLARSAAGIEIAVGRSSLLLVSDPPPLRLWRDGRPWNGRPYTGALGELSARWELRVRAGQEQRIRLAVLAPNGAARRRRPGSGAPPADGRAAAESHYTGWLEGVPRMAVPEAPALERAYALAAGALRSLYYAPEPGFAGLRAGVPWYSTLWGRDLAIMAPALLWMGDAAWVEASLRTLFRFQAPERIPLLGAEVGELPMQLSPGPAFLFGTADTTLYFPALIERLVDHTGSGALAAELTRGLEQIHAYLSAKSEPRSGWVRHGGEVAEIEEATSGLSSVRCGIDAADTTVWDSADRRDSAVDVQVLAIAAWRSLGALAARAGDSGLGTALRHRGDALAYRLPLEFAWPEERYLVDSLRDGRPVHQLRPNALRAVSAGLLATEPARELVRRASRPDLSTDWGVRTLSSRDPAYDPLSYHDGPVWPLATAWAADASFAAGELSLALGHLGRLARTLVDERGYANECYRGDRAEPRNSCPLLGFSVAPYLALLFERLWGVRPRLDRGEIELAPALPAAWSRASVRGIRLGPGRLDLELGAEGLAARYEGPSAVTLVGPSGLRSPTGRSVRLELPRSAKGS